MPSARPGRFRPAAADPERRAGHRSGIGAFRLAVVLFATLPLPSLHARTPQPIPVKVMIVNMFAPEGAPWIERRGLSRVVAVPGLSPDDPAVHCGADAVCQVTTGMGYANAAASIAAVVYSKRFDLRHAYWLVAGVAGINPHLGTLGSVAWARFLVDGGLQWEVDGREVPANWRTGYLGIGARTPEAGPSLGYHTELYELDPELVRRAVVLSKDVALTDSAAARKTRAAYPAPANRPPSVLQCDTVSDDTWTSGTRLSERFEAWTRILTGDRGTACTTQQEDNATYTVLRRADAAHLVDDRRVLVLRAGSDFDRPPPGGGDLANLFAYQAQGGFAPAIDNLFLAGNRVVQDMVANWKAWR